MKISISVPANAQATEHHLALVRRTLAAQLDKNNRLTELINRQSEAIAAQADTICKLEERLGSVGVNGWQTIERQRVINAEQATRITELEAENEALQESLDSKCVGVWEVVTLKDRCITEQAKIIHELNAEKDALMAENVRLTGQVHALVCTLEAAL